MSTDLARALDEELARQGVQTDDLPGPGVAYALLVFEALAQNLRDVEESPSSALKSLTRHRGLDWLHTDLLKQWDYRELRSRVAHDLARTHTAAQLQEELNRFLTTERDRLPADAVQLDAEDYEAVREMLAARLARRQAYRSWEEHIGPLLSHQQALDLTGWSKQALSKAVNNHRVLRLRGAQGKHFYPQIAFDDGAPARPLPNAKGILTIWAHADPRGWITGAWLNSPKAELAGRSPREVLLEGGDAESLEALARQATQRLAA